MIILGIETSCDETALSVIKITKSADGGKEIKILANKVLSQIAVHQQYGGVFPMMAKREHAKNLIPLFRSVLEKAGSLKPQDREIYSSILQNTEINLRRELKREPELLKQFMEFVPTIEKPPIDLIAVTAGPGLEPCLWTGLNFAKALSVAWDIPVVAANHMEGHILVSLLQRNEELSIFNSQFSKRKTTNYKLQTINFPALALLISGGHTEMVLMKAQLKYEVVGKTRDDAVGEAFDKVARILGLPYPGGPEISRLADSARMRIHADTNADARELNPHLSAPSAISDNPRSNPRESAPLKLPRPMLHSEDLDFSFSGLKTAVLYLVKKLEQEAEKGHPRLQMEIAKEFEDAVTEVLVEKVKKAVELYGVKTLILGGGVVANTHIRNAFEKLASEQGLSLNLPEIDHATDNALMIALAGYFNRADAVTKTAGLAALEAQGNLSFTMAA